MVNRRAILTGMAGILASGFAPAAIGSGVLMPVRKIGLPTVRRVLAIRQDYKIDRGTGDVTIFAMVDAETGQVLRSEICSLGQSPFVVRREWLSLADLVKRFPQ